MSAALKKLKKLKAKSIKKSNQQLKALKNTTSNASHHRGANLGANGTNRALAELREVAKDAGTAAMVEFATPFRPLLSWFNEGDVAMNFIAANDRVLDQSAPEAKGIPANHQPKSPLAKSRSFQPVSKQSLARIPFKSPACKRCPALAGGLCKCAMKKLSA